MGKVWEEIKFLAAWHDKNDRQLAKQLPSIIQGLDLLGLLDTKIEPLKTENSTPAVMPKGRKAKATPLPTQKPSINNNFLWTQHQQDMDDLRTVRHDTKVEATERAGILGGITKLFRIQINTYSDTRERTVVPIIPGVFAADDSLDADGNPKGIEVSHGRSRHRM